MAVRIGYVALAVNAVTLVLTWAGMGTDWGRVCGGSLCVYLKLFLSTYGGKATEYEATEAFATIGMLCFAGGMVGGLLLIFTQLNKKLAFFGALGGNIAGAVCSVIAVGIFGGTYLTSPYPYSAGPGIVLYGLCIVLGVITAVLHAVEYKGLPS